MPSTGTKISIVVQPALLHPPMSRRLKTSPRTMMRHQNHITHRKNTNMVHKMSKNG